uniref:MYB11 n=1 Tax=Cucurbita pepo TaxID=3663 RepID=A0A345BTH7_CUCPE|nr:MYB11 [Cucurbita pepo]
MIREQGFKQAKQLNINSNSQQFFETVHHLWIPRLLQKMDKKSSSTSYNYNSPFSRSFSQALLQNPSASSSSEPTVEAHRSSEVYYEWPESSGSVSEELGSSDLQPLNNEFQVDQQLQDPFSLFGGCRVTEFSGQMAGSD